MVQSAKEEPDARAYLEKISQQPFTSSGTSNFGAQPFAQDVELVIPIGRIDDEILRAADNYKADIIIIATHGYSGIRRWEFGSVANALLRKSAVPVWLERAGAFLEHTANLTIIVPLDGSNISEGVLPHIKAMAMLGKGQKPTLILTRIIEPMFINSDYPESTMLLNCSQHLKLMKDYQRNQASNYLHGIAKTLGDSDFNIQIKVLTGDAAEKIIELSRSFYPSLVVLTARGLSMFGDWEFGHVADKVLHNGQVPVFLVRSK